MKVLVAEDDRITLMSIQACLDDDGFETIPAANGREAIERFRNDKPDLVCLDIMMPEIDGFEACRTIRKEDAEVPILFLSAKNEEVDVVAGLDLGADDFVRKPFGKDELLARIRSIIRRAGLRKPNPDKFQMRALTVFPKELRAVRDGESIDLSPREVSILQLLNQRANEAVSREDLHRECWGIDYFPESRTLDQHVAQLRKRIETDPTAPDIIETVRGVGYRFNV